MFYLKKQAETSGLCFNLKPSFEENRDTYNRIKIKIPSKILYQANGRSENRVIIAKNHPATKYENTPETIIPSTVNPTSLLVKENPFFITS